MESKKNVCRVCGTSYTPCVNLRGDSAVFNWKAVACSHACGTKYFNMIEEGRKPKGKAKQSVKLKDVKVSEPEPVAIAAEESSAALDVVE